MSRRGDVLLTWAVCLAIASTTKVGIAQCTDTAIQLSQKQMLVAAPEYSKQIQLARRAAIEYKWAGGGFLSTAEDLARFGSALLKPGFLKQDTLAMLFSRQETSAGKSTKYGLGWFIHDAGDDGTEHRQFDHTYRIYNVPLLKPIGVWKLKI